MKITKSKDGVPRFTLRMETRVDSFEMAGRIVSALLSKGELSYFSAQQRPWRSWPRLLSIKRRNFSTWSVTTSRAMALRVLIRIFVMKSLIRLSSSFRKCWLKGFPNLLKALADGVDARNSHDEVL